MSHLPNWQEYGPPASGADKQKDAVAVHDEAYGVAKDPVEDVPTMDRLPTVHFPVANPTPPYTVK